MIIKHIGWEIVYENGNKILQFVIVMRFKFRRKDTTDNEDNSSHWSLFCCIFPYLIRICMLSTRINLGKYSIILESIAQAEGQTSNGNEFCINSPKVSKIFIQRKRKKINFFLTTYIDRLISLLSIVLTLPLE